MVMTTATTTHPYDLTPGAMLFGHLRLQQVFGRGFFRVLDVLTQRDYVLVIGGPSDREITRRRVHHVGIALAGESIPGIASITETAAFGEWSYTLGAMPDGMLLRDKLETDRILPRADLRSLAKGVFAALGVAHERGIIHGALTPACVAMQGDNVVLIGFAAPSEGADEYTSPEVRMGRTPTASDDLYSVGVILTECSGLNLDTARTPITHAALAVLQRLTASQRENRYPDARTAATAFDAVFAAGIEAPKPILKSEPFTPVPPSRVITAPLPVVDLPTKAAVEHPEPVELGQDSVAASQDQSAATSIIPVDDELASIDDVEAVDVSPVVSYPLDTSLMATPEEMEALETVVIPTSSETSVLPSPLETVIEPVVLDPPAPFSFAPVSPVFSSPVAPQPPRHEPKSELAVLSVSIAGDPAGACVWWDGRKIGYLPVVIPESKRGHHLVAIELAGYIRQEIGVNLQSDLEMTVGLVPIPVDSETQPLPEDLAELVGPKAKAPWRGWGIAALLAGLAVLGGGLAFGNPPAVVTGLTTSVGAFGSLIIR